MAEDRHVEPWPGTLSRLMELPDDHPIDMLNLVRFRAKAAYPPGHECSGRGLSGEQAFRLFVDASLPVMSRHGGGIFWSAVTEAEVIGPPKEHWDIAYVARFGTGRDFLLYLADHDYARALVHRGAAVETSRLIRMRAGVPEQL